MHARVNGTRLFYTLHGQGRPLLVMHGGPGLSHAYLRPWLDRLGDRVQLIYYDQRGSGRSGPLGTPAEVGSFETWAADAEALRVHLGHERLLVFGHSFGGFLALEYAVRYGVHLDGLVLCATAPTIHYHTVVEAAARTVRERAELRPLLRALARRGATAGRRSRTPAEVVAARRARLAEHFRLHDPGADPPTGQTGYPAATSPHDSGVALPIPDPPPTLANITAPTLVIAGRRDPVAPPERGPIPLAGALPNTELVLLEESGHFPFMEEPDAFTARVAAWLNRFA